MHHRALAAFLTLLNGVFLFFPSSYQWMKAAYLAVMLVLFLVMWYADRIEISRDILFLFAASIALGMLLNLYDLYRNGAPFITIRIYVLDVAAYLLVVAVFSSLRGMGDILARSIYLAAFLVSANITGFILCSLSGTPYPLEFLPLDYRFGLDERGFLAYSTNNLPVLIFAVPYMAADVLLNRSGSVRTGVLLLSIAAGLLSLRSALIAGMAGSIVILYLYDRMALRRRFFAPLAVLAVGGCIAALPFLRNAELAGGLYQLKLADKVSGEDYRYAQARVWGELIAAAPLLGHGTAAMGLTADEDGTMRPTGRLDNPYGYELSWLRRAALIGTAATLAYLCMILYLAKSLWRLRMSGNRGAALGLLAGMAAFLIADNTNGYLETLGYLWIIFFPAAFVSRAACEAGDAAAA